MSNKYLDYGTQYNVGAEITGGGKFQEDLGVPIDVWDPTSAQSASCEATYNELELNYKTVEDVTGAFPPVSPVNNRLYKDGNYIYWYDEDNLEFDCLNPDDDTIDHIEIVDPLQEVYISSDFKGFVNTYDNLPDVDTVDPGTMYNVRDVQTLFKASTVQWNAQTAVPYLDMTSDHFYTKQNTDDIWWWEPGAQRWISVFNGTGTGEANIIEHVEVNGVRLPETSKIVDASSLENKIESISVNGVAQTIDVNKNVDIISEGEPNIIESILVNGNPVPIAGKAAAITVEDPGEDNVIEVIKFNGAVVPVTDKVAEITGAGEENVIEVVKVSGVALPVDPNEKSVNISTGQLFTSGREVVADDNGVIGHNPNAAIVPETTESFKTTKLSTYGHALSYTTKTFGRGVGDQNDIIGHTNFVTASPAVNKVYAVQYDQYGHITGIPDPYEITTTLVDDDTKLLTSKCVYDAIGDITAILAELNDGDGA